MERPSWSAIPPAVNADMWKMFQRIEKLELVKAGEDFDRMVEAVQIAIAEAIEKTQTPLFTGKP